MEEAKISFWKRCQLTERDRRNQSMAVVWLFLWALSWVVASIVLKEGWASEGIWTAVVAILPNLFGIGMMIAYWRFVRQADELQRKIQLDALALGFGTGVVGAVAYQLLERAGMIAEAEVIDLSAFMMVAFAIGTVLGARRYA